MLVWYISLFLFVFSCRNGYYLVSIQCASSSDGSCSVVSEKLTKAWWRGKRGKYIVLLRENDVDCEVLTNGDADNGDDDDEDENEDEDDGHDGDNWRYDDDDNAEEEEENDDDDDNDGHVDGHDDDKWRCGDDGGENINSFEGNKINKRLFMI